MHMNHPHHRDHAFSALNARTREGLTLVSRRGMIKAGLAGLAGLSLPALLQRRGDAAATGKSLPSGKSVILLWMAGGPSHIDTWDPKPDRPPENRGPFAPIATKLPGVLLCEYLPKQAAMLDKMTIIRSVDPQQSNHEPNKVFQTGNREAAPRVNPKGEKHPAIGSLVAKLHGANQRGMPAYAAFMRSPSHLAFSGWLGRSYDPFIANQATKLPVYSLTGEDTGQTTRADLFVLPDELPAGRIDRRQDLLAQFDRLRRDLDLHGSMNSLDVYSQQAVELVTGQRARQAFDIELEPEKSRQRYGKHLWCQQTLLARRLVEAGAAFVTIDLSYHTASGTWDTHGDNIPPYGGIWNGLRPLLPLFDHLLTTLVSDLEERGLLDDVLVIAMGEFGRTPILGTQESSDGRNHWPVVMSMTLAGGGLRHGQVIGASERDGGHIKERPVTPADLAATIYRHFGIPLDATYEDDRNRPRYIVEEGGQPIRELF